MKFPPVYAALICAGLMAAPAATGALGPRLTFATNEYNFGRAVAGTQVKYVYIVTNTGDETLVISNVAPGCHCTTAGDWTHKIEPGQTGKIPIQFDSTAFGHDVIKNIKVNSNDKLAPFQTLVLRGTVWRLIEISPDMAYINIMPDALSNATSVLHLVNQTDEPVTLSNPTSTNDSFKAEMKTITPGKDFEVTVTAQPPFVSGNSMGGSISIKTSFTNLPVLNIRAFAVVQPVVSLMPPQINLSLQIDRWTTNLVTITANEGGELTLSAPEASDKRIGVDIKPITPGRVFQLIAIFPPGYQLAPGQTAQVSIKSSKNISERPMIVVPIMQGTSRTAAQLSSQSATGPRMTFLTNEYRFDKMAAGTKVKYVFIATNTGDQTLVISNVAPEDLCITAGNWTRQFQPGQTGEIPVQFDSSALRGDVAKNITVTSNDKLAPSQTLTLRGTVWRQIEVAPESALFNLLPNDHSKLTNIVHLVNQTDGPVTVSDATSANGSFKAELKTITPGKEFELIVTTVPPFPSGSAVGGSVSVKTSLTNLPVINIQVLATPQAP